MVNFRLVLLRKLGCIKRNVCHL